MKSVRSTLFRFIRRLSYAVRIDSSSCRVALVGGVNKSHPHAASIPSISQLRALSITSSCWTVFYTVRRSNVHLDRWSASFTGCHELSIVPSCGFSGDTVFAVESPLTLSYDDHFPGHFHIERSPTNRLPLRNLLSEHAQEYPAGDVVGLQLQPPLLQANSGSSPFIFLVYRPNKFPDTPQLVQAGVSQGIKDLDVVCLRPCHHPCGSCEWEIGPSPVLRGAWMSGFFSRTPGCLSHCQSPMKVSSIAHTLGKVEAQE